MREFLRFAVVGGLATATHLAVFCGLHLGLGAHPTLSTVAAFAVAVVLSYLLNRRWTFRATGRHARQAPRFAVVALAGAALNAAVMQAGVEGLGWPPALALAVICATLPVATFVAQRRWSFR